MASAVRNTALRAGGACVRCRKGKTKCVYENGRAPCRNCAKGMHECYLPSESMAHHHGQSPARHSGSNRPARDHVPASSGPGASDNRQPAVGSGGARHVPPNAEKLTPELVAECERVVSKTFPACVAFHKPSFIQSLKNAALESSLVYGLLTCAARSSPILIRRYGSPTTAAETYAAKAIALINQNLDQPNLADIQALCLLIIHEWGSRNAVRAYIYLGQAARMLQMYRILNNHHVSDNADQFLRDESLRRTLWLIYLLDCFLTSTPGRNVALSSQDITDVALPCTDINFAFGNAVFVKTLHEQLNRSALSPSRMATADVGEFGHIVLAATVWRDVVGMLLQSGFREESCTDLLIKIENLRASLPMQFVEKPGQINLHITMGSGYTFAMLHCLLHCASIFVHRRRLLQDVTSPSFNIDSFRMSQRCHDTIDHLLNACHGTISLLTAVEAGSEKDYATCFPLFMLFSAFTASATVAYLSLRGLTPAHAADMAAQIVKDGLRFMEDGTENWPLMSSWLRHLSVMQRVLNNDAAAAAAAAAVASATQNGGSGRHGSNHHGSQSAMVKQETGSSADSNSNSNSNNNNPDAMDHDYDQQSGGHGARARSGSGSARGDSEPPVALPRRPGVTTINGGSANVSSPGTASPPANNHASANEDAIHVHEGKHSPGGGDEGGDATMSADDLQAQDMTAPELCAAFERQLLDLDDLAAFMGGGV